MKKVLAFFIAAIAVVAVSCQKNDNKGNSDIKAWRVYGLDRILGMKESGKTFKMPKDFDVDSLFYNSFGVFFPKEGQRSVTVRFRATESEARYLRDLPLHRSQKEEGPAEGGGRQPCGGR